MPKPTCVEDLSAKQFSELKRIALQEASVFGPIEANRIFRPSLRGLSRKLLIVGIQRRRAVPLVILSRAGWDLLFAKDPDFVRQLAPDLRKQNA